jgi:multiple sugar transport system substrate-binding protein
MSWISFRFRQLIVVCLFCALVGCNSLPIRLGSGSATATGNSNVTQTPVVSETVEAGKTASPGAADVTAVITPAENGDTLRIWLPPQFDPEGDSAASRLLKSRLEEFAAQNPAVQLDVRVKALDGPGGMLESMVAAGAAAPSALPDLVLLPRGLLESAALKGLIYPYDGLTNAMDDPTWFEYARQLAQVKNSQYGIPFAGDALTLAFRPSILDAPPQNLSSIIALGLPLLYPAADPQALYTFAMYLAAGGGLQDSTGRPMLDEATLNSILTYDQQASQAGVMPLLTTELSTDAQVWEAFKDDQYPMAALWASTYLNNVDNAQTDLKLATLPASNSAPYTLASGWSWALAGSTADKRSLSVKLAEYLTEKDFMAEWTQAAGYLPPKSDALQNWQATDVRSSIEAISTSARLLPAEDLISSLGPVLEQAVVKVLKAQSDPQSAAQAAVNQVNQP